jgi:hypothetical protein
MTSDVIKAEVGIFDEMFSPEILKGCWIHIHNVVRNHKI